MLFFEQYKGRDTQYALRSHTPVEQISVTLSAIQNRIKSVLNSLWITKTVQDQKLNVLKACENYLEKPSSSARHALKQTIKNNPYYNYAFFYSKSEALVRSVLKIQTNVLETKANLIATKRMDEQGFLTKNYFKNAVQPEPSSVKKQATK